MKYNGLGWTTIPMPAGFENGAFSWIRMTDEQNGWTVWEGYSGGRSLFEWNAGVSTEVSAPAGCEGNVPTQVFGVDGYALTVDRSGPDNRFWEYRAGGWSCRNVGGELYDSRLAHAVILGDGRVFIAAWTEAAPYYSPLVFQVGEDDLSPVDLPEGMVRINGLHALGPDAPAHSPLVAP